MLSAERGYRLRIQVRPGGKLLLGPFGMAIWKIFWMFRVQADRVLQDRRRDAMRRRLHRLQAEAAADTAAQHVEFFEIEIVHQRDTCGSPLRGSTSRPGAGRRCAGRRRARVRVAAARVDVAPGACGSPLRGSPPFRVRVAAVRVAALPGAGRRCVGRRPFGCGSPLRGSPPRPGAGRRCAGRRPSGCGSPLRGSTSRPGAGRRCAGRRRARCGSPLRGSPPFRVRVAAARVDVAPGAGRRCAGRRRARCGSPLRGSTSRPVRVAAARVYVAPGAGAKAPPGAGRRCAGRRRARCGSPLRGSTSRPVRVLKLRGDPGEQQGAPDRSEDVGRNEIVRVVADEGREAPPVRKLPRLVRSFRSGGLAPEGTELLAEVAYFPAAHLVHTFRGWG